MTSDLTAKKCVPCEGGVARLRGSDLGLYQDRISSRWRIVDEHHLRAVFLFDDFAGALGFTNEVGHLAENEGHHPDLHLSWGRVEVTVWTHAIDGLSENDFILAAKIDLL